MNYGHQPDKKVFTSALRPKPKQTHLYYILMFSSNKSFATKSLMIWFVLVCTQLHLLRIKKKVLKSLVSSTNILPPPPSDPFSFVIMCSGNYKRELCYSYVCFGFVIIKLTQKKEEKKETTILKVSSKVRKQVQKSEIPDYK